MSSAKWRTFCLGLNVLTVEEILKHIKSKFVHSTGPAIGLVPWLFFYKTIQHRQGELIDPREIWE